MAIAATAPCAWGVWYPDDPSQVPWQQYLDEAAKAGFGYTEAGPWGYLPTDPSHLADELDARALRICGAALVHGLAAPDAFATFREQLSKNCQQLLSFDAKWVVVMDDDVPGGRGDSGLSGEDWARLVANTIEAAKFVSGEFGLRLVFHPHVGTGVETEAEVDRLLAETPPGLVDLCFDFGHHGYTGADAVDYLKRNHSRMPYLHFKNVDADIIERINEENIDYITGFGMGAMCELDKGIIDFSEVRDFLFDQGFSGFAVYEQDMHPCPPEKPFPIARHNRAVMRSLGI